MTRPESIAEPAINQKTRTSPHFDLSFEVQIFFSFLLNCFKKDSSEVVAKAKFYDKIRVDCLQEHNNLFQLLSTKHLNWTLLGVHCVLFQPLSSFLHLLSERQEHLIMSKKLILSISYCLNENNVKYLDYISKADLSEHLEMRRKLLQDFLIKSLKGKQNKLLLPNYINLIKYTFFTYIAMIHHTPKL